MNQDPIDPELEAIHNSMLDGLGQLSDYFGFGKIMGKLYMTVLLSRDSLCLDDFVERLQISKASVSTNLKTLEHLGIVQREWSKDSSDRRKFYRAETDFWQIISKVLESRELKNIDRAITTMQSHVDKIQAIKDQLSQKDQELAELYLERIEKLKALFRFADFAINMIVTSDKDQKMNWRNSSANTED